MKIISTQVEGGQLGEQLRLTVSGLDPNMPDGHDVLIPTVCIPDRRKLHGVPTEKGHENCMCAECENCTEVLELILAEHFARLNPDKLDRLDQRLAERLVKRQAVPGKRWVGGKIVSDDATAPRSKVLKIKGLKVR